MTKKEIIDNFGFDRSTLNNWENGTNEARKLLYKTLNALPLEFVENVKIQDNLRIDNEELLKDIEKISELIRGKDINNTLDFIEALKPFINQKKQKT